jgi:toxin CptA
MPTGFAVGPATLIGGALLGIGALINGACAFGAIARLGSGQWAYAATPVGFLAGCLFVHMIWPTIDHGPSLASPVLGFAAPVAGGFALLVCWRGAQALRTPQSWQHLWHPHRAALLIGVTFVATMLAVGSWTYTNALADLARMMGEHLSLPLAMFGALLAGAISGGWLAGLINPLLPTPLTVIRCLAGGGLMGAGSMLVPGGNDGLIMTGLPLLMPHAWAAVAMMTLAIAVPMLIGKRLSVE